MFIDAPAYDGGPPAIYVAAQAQPSGAAIAMLNKLGVCNEYRANDVHPVSPIAAAEHYFLEYKKGPAVVVQKGPNLVVREEDSEIEVAKPPKHGTLEPWKAYAESTSKTYHYKPNKDYVGEDSFEMEVSLDGESLRIYYQVKVFAEDEDFKAVGYCNWNDQKYYWKISQSPLAGGALDAAPHPLRIVLS